MATNVVSFNAAQLPAFAKNAAPSALSKALTGAGAGAGYGKRVSIKGGVFRLVVNGKEVAAIEERYLDVAIVNAAPDISRKFYGVKYDESVASAPQCWSSDGRVPDTDVRAKQASACASCEQNIKGSGDGDSKACRYQQRIAVVLANDLEGEVLQLEVPGKSLFGKEENGNFPMQAYARWLDAQSIVPNMVVTRIKFDTAESHPKLFFKTMRWLTDDEHGVLIAQGSTEDAKNAVLLNMPKDAVSSPSAAVPKKLAAPVVETEDEPPAPAPKATKTKAKAKAEEPEVEPTVRKAADTPELPARKNLADVVSNWDTDD